MRRIIGIVAIFFLLGVGLGTWTKNREPNPDIKGPTTHYHGYELNRLAIKRAKEFTVLISNEGFYNGERGTGVLIDATHVLTCAHVVKNIDDDIWIFPYPGRILVKGKPVVFDRSVDLAVLELNRSVPLAHYATFQEMHYDGEPITIIGNMMGSMKWFVSFGVISSDFKGFLLTDGLINGGNSGGPWINEQGEVVALTDWTLVHDNIDRGIHGGVMAKTIHEFLKSWRSPPLGALLQMLLGSK